MADVVGLLLAAGAGRRMGQPKALLRDPDGTSWLQRSLDVLAAGGCAPVAVVLGARADEARAYAHGAEVVVATDWAEGMGASLRAGLRYLVECYPDREAVLVHLVDLPDVGADVVTRLRTSSDPIALARATYDAMPGHPVLIGRTHWAALVEEVSGDAGARDYLARHGVVDIECGDLAKGHDVDHP